MAAKKKGGRATPKRPSTYHDVAPPACGPVPDDDPGYVTWLAWYRRMQRHPVYIRRTVLVGR